MIGTDHVVQSSLVEELFDLRPWTREIGTTFAIQTDSILWKIFGEGFDTPLTGNATNYQPSPEKASLGEVRLRSAVHPVSIS